MQALKLPVELVDEGDVVAIGQRFYRVESIADANRTSEFPLIVLCSLESGARAAIECRNTSSQLSVLRFPAAARGGEEASDAPTTSAVPQWGWSA